MYHTKTKLLTLSTAMPKSSSLVRWKHGKRNDKYNNLNLVHETEQRQTLVL
jgi:hypothetical protein